jgi:hypothetical protein
VPLALGNAGLMIVSRRSTKVYADLPAPPGGQVPKAGAKCMHCTQLAEFLHFLHLFRQPADLR